jgi:hypothetical protein
MLKANNAFQRNLRRGFLIFGGEGMSSGTGGTESVMAY